MTASEESTFSGINRTPGPANGHTGPALTLISAGGTVPVVSASGELDLYSLAPLRELLGGALDPAPASSQVVMDLSRVDFLDTEILKELLSWRDRLRRRGGELWVVRCGTRAMRVFEVTGRKDGFTVCRSRRAAVQAAANAAAKDGR